MIERDSLNVELDNRQNALQTATQNLSQVTSELQELSKANEHLQKGTRTLCTKIVVAKSR